MGKEHSSNAGEAAAFQEDCRKGKQRFEHSVEVPHVHSRLLGLTLRCKIFVSRYVAGGKTDTFSPFLPTSNQCRPLAHLILRSHGG